jgi:hypothetical protein
MMAQRIVTVCDVHQAHDAEAEGFTWTVSIAAPGAKAVTYDVDLCGDDGKGLQDVLDFLADMGRPASGVRPSRTPRKASQDLPTETTNDGRPVCAQCGKVAKSMQGLRMHLTRSHGGTDAAE